MEFCGEHYDNAAQKVSSVMWTLIPGAMAVPHQLALVTAAMYESHVVATAAHRFSAGVGGLPPDNTLAYADYAALVNSLPPGPNIHRLHETMNALGFSYVSLRESVDAPIAVAVAAAFPLSIPPPMNVPPNPLSDYWMMGWVAHWQCIVRDNPRSGRLATALLPRT